MMTARLGASIEVPPHGGRISGKIRVFEGELFPSPDATVRVTVLTLFFPSRLKRFFFYFFDVGQEQNRAEQFLPWWGKLLTPEKVK